MFPSLRPDRRSDVVLLEQWLTDTMRLLSAQFPAQPASDAPQVLSPPERGISDVTAPS